MTPSETPAISVLIAVHNGQPYVESAIRSIMEQTFRDIEIVVVDDASTDDTPEVLARLAAEDPRLRIETAKTNLRLPGALNHGLTLCRAPLIARMDADDIALPTRLEVQKAYMDAHPEIDLIGTGMQKITSDGTLLRRDKRAYDAYACRWLTRFTMPLVHPTFMFRATPPEGMDLRYDPEFSVSEDYDFCARMAQAGNVASLPEVLLEYRVHGTSISLTKRDLQMTQARQIAERVQRADLPEDIMRDLAILLDVHYGNAPVTGVNVAKMFAAFQKMIDFDTRQHPERRRWMKRRAARIIWYYLVYERIEKFHRVGLYLRYGLSFAVPLVMEKLEGQDRLPAPLQSIAPVWTRATP